MQRPAACIMDLYGKAAATFVKTAFADFDSVGVSLKVTLICHFQSSIGAGAPAATFAKTAFADFDSVG